IGISTATTINNGATKIVGPITWHASDIPDPGTFHHPCLLAEVVADNNDSAGGPDSKPVPGEGDKNSCNYSSFFWGSNDVTQRNLSYLNLSALSATMSVFPSSSATYSARPNS